MAPVNRTELASTDLGLFTPTTMSALAKLHFTPEEYLSLELPAEYKSQYVAGEIFAMAGGQPWHNHLSTNIIIALGNQLRGRSCRVFNSDMRVRVKSADMYTYPDVSALCGKPVFETDDNPQSLLNPQVIFEVLSPSTATFDRGDKFTRYRRLESLVDYVLVDSEQVGIEHHLRLPSGAWTMNPHEHPANVLKLASVTCELTLAEIYDQVTFPPRRI